MYCDRDTTIIPKSQIGFLKNIALPLYETLNSYLNSPTIESTCVEQIKSNIASWEYEHRAGAHKTLKESQLLKLFSDLQVLTPLYECKSSGDASAMRSK